MARHRLIGDDRDLASRPEPGDPLAERREQAAPDHDVIGAVAERDIDGDRIAGAQGRGHGAVPSGAFRRCTFGRDTAAQAFQDFIDDGFVRHVARFHRDVGFGIDRIALLDQPPQRLRRIDVLEQRTIAAALDPAVEDLEGGAQPDRNSLGADRRAGVGVHERAAAGGQHLRAALQEPRDHARLAGAEIRLAVGGEDFRDGHAGGFFDLDVGIDERNAEPAGKPAADRRLARAHHADQHHRAAAQRCAERRLRLRRGAVMCDDIRHAILVSKSDDGINRDLKR